jgi:hypothetical protein
MKGRYNHQDKNIQQVMSPNNATVVPNVQQQDSTGGEGSEHFDVQYLIMEIRRLREEVNVLRSSQRHDAQNERPVKNETDDERCATPVRKLWDQAQVMSVEELGGPSPVHRAKERESIFSPAGISRASGEKRRIPQMKDMKLSIVPFDGTEVYPGLGAGFDDWGRRFVREVTIAEEASGMTWPEDLKVDRLNRCLSGKAERFFSECVDNWWSECPTLWYILEQTSAAYKTQISGCQGL